MKTTIICANSDLGLTTDGCDLGPKLISKNIVNKNIINIDKENIKKSKDKNDLRKNLREVNVFNKKLYDAVLNTINSNKFPITIGGDHSIAIGSALGSKKINKNIGIIWIDAHLDYNTFETTITGNIHGLPLAALNGMCKDLTEFYNDEYFNPENTVVVGYRAMEENKEQELNNINKMGVTVFTNNDIKEYGIDYIMEKAFDIALNNTDGVHISYDLDIIDKSYAPGVSVPEPDGIDINTANRIKDILTSNINKIKSFDLVEFNPNFDIDNKTLNIATNIINDIISKK